MVVVLKRKRKRCVELLMRDEHGETVTSVEMRLREGGGNLSTDMPGSGRRLTRLQCDSAARNRR